ncbi:hypothetical protein AAFF_G00441440 [Aldrovandia affinis]|uniref:Uncharacterized protein n=1 Tax=Aldrovandia affinis TaxID=143900 RepID=A0AAD7S7C6_9TELE|nr:hypothetical protein AAFF_G00441440 [Aldrovandia affinis]
MKMRPSKAPASTQEQCGVWLDTAELRGKRTAVRPRRPISKLLNPLAPSGGYSVSVALSFTQTRLRFPAMTQSSITSFLSPRRHGKDESGSAKLLCTPASAGSGRKRKYSGGPLPQVRAAGGAVQGYSPPHSEEEEEEEEEPTGERLWTSDGTQTLRCHFTQDSEGNRVLAHRGEGKENAPSPLNPALPVSTETPPPRPEPRPAVHPGHGGTAGDRSPRTPPAQDPPEGPRQPLPLGGGALDCTIPAWPAGGAGPRDAVYPGL